MQTSTKKTVFFLVISLIAVCIAAILSVFLGSTDISWQTVLSALFSPDLSDHQQIAILELRLPRTIGDLLVGAGLAGAGAMMQGMTRNPLADSGLLGINAGASFGLAICLAFLSNVSFGLTIIVSFIGAAISVFLVFGLLMMKRRKLDASRLVLAGLAVSMFLTALTQGISILTNTGQSLTFWSAGGTAGIRMDQLKIAAPVMIVALVCGILLSRQVSLLSLGDEAAQGLGLNLNRSKLFCLLVVLVLAGTSTALAGPVSFVGLLVPHIVSRFVGSRYEAIIPASMVCGSLLMVLADLVARTLNAPSETPVGLIFALIGVPAFIIISRKEGDNEA
ncbi:FecCD family ABC transporter permease [Allobaculum mucilyticum]|uniref:FecCD family ABC transporter permease n=1 Tax=Allobaculum mucilyticum TaxID=2834459 RepID=UPI001E65B6DB|nr:iron ABC transporter permease [Allobaculum mucilyticum]UNT95555.1 iron ABC transporter permease [Allobaculum mucilyticum]